MAKMKTENKSGTTLDKSARKEVTVGFPVEAEVIAALSYTIKIEALPDTKQVEISLNDKTWEPCREALGIWWFDWEGYTTGDYAVRARAVNEKGNVAMSAWRHFSVTKSPKE